MINFRYQVIIATKDSRQVLHTAGTQKAALEYVSFLLSKRDLNEPLEYIIKPVSFVTEDAQQ